MYGALIKRTPPRGTLCNFTKLPLCPSQTLSVPCRSYTFAALNRVPMEASGQGPPPTLLRSSYPSLKYGLGSSWVQSLGLRVSSSRFGFYRVSGSTGLQIQNMVVTDFR